VGKGVGVERGCGILGGGRVDATARDGIHYAGSASHCAGRPARSHYIAVSHVSARARGCGNGAVVGAGRGWVDVAKGELSRSCKGGFLRLRKTDSTRLRFYTTCEYKSRGRWERGLGSRGGVGLLGGGWVDALRGFESMMQGRLLTAKEDRLYPMPSPPPPEASGSLSLKSPIPSNPGQNSPQIEKVFEDRPG
jgi:hypothetical protein